MWFSDCKGREFTQERLRNHIPDETDSRKNLKALGLSLGTRCLSFSCGALYVHNGKEDKTIHVPRNDRLVPTGICSQRYHAELRLPFGQLLASDGSVPLSGKQLVAPWTKLSQIHEQSIRGRQASSSFEALSASDGVLMNRVTFFKVN